MRRRACDLSIYEGEYKDFEWYWNETDEMPGLDAYEKLDAIEQAAFLAALEHWGSCAPGERPLESRVAKEHDDPLILAVKTPSHRFPAFHAGNDRWIIAMAYKKKGQKLGKSGSRAIKRALRAVGDYEQRIKASTYYERQ
jgi:hypothetical protein